MVARGDAEDSAMVIAMLLSFVGHGERMNEICSLELTPIDCALRDVKISW